jgi:hypothetical protein
VRPDAQATLDRSGYLREAGVRHLGEVAVPTFALAFLLVRAQEPVLPVRERAGTALRTWLGPGQAPTPGGGVAAGGGPECRAPGRTRDAAHLGDR